MSIHEQLSEDLKTAMKAHDDVSKDTLRLIRAAIQNAEIEKGASLDGEGVTGVLARMAKRYRDSITTYGDAGRKDLVAKEESELAVLARYMPEQMNADDVRRLVEQVAAEVGAAGPSDKGKLMGKLMPQVRGKADGAVVNQMATEYLESLA